MPSRKPLRRYPSEYRDLFFRVKAEGCIILNFTSARLATNFRRDIYNYRLALWEETPRPPTHEAQLLLDIADETSFRLRENRVIATIKESAYAQHLRSQLEEYLDES